MANIVTANNINGFITITFLNASIRLSARRSSAEYFTVEERFSISDTGIRKKNPTAKSAVFHVLLLAFILKLTKNEFFDVISGYLRFAYKYFFQ